MRWHFQPIQDVARYNERFAMRAMQVRRVRAGGKLRPQGGNRRNNRPLCMRKS